MEFGRFMGSLHPVLIHFPIVLLLTAVAVEAVAFFQNDPRFRWAGKLILLAGAVSTLFAFVCGNFAELWAARSGISQEALEYHELLATITSWSFVALTGWRLLMRDGDQPTPRLWRGIWLAAAMGASIGLVYTGFHGGELVYNHAAAVHGVGLQRIPPHEDLLALTQRQDKDSIFYSDMMHHIFGWMVLLLSALLLLDQVAPKLASKARRIGPLVLLAGGAFLLVFSDQDAWPLYHVHPLRPIYDKEVLLHKTYAILMLAIGLRGVWQWIRNSNTLHATRNTQSSQDRVMAVFALVGGALLFTHVHSAAPYANIACGVYIHHTTMGLVALGIGAVKLFDDILTRPSTLRRLAYPALMCCEAILLINYNEGLPWFMGFRHFSNQSAHGGSVAPFGPNRGEMVYNPETARLEVYVESPDSAQPTPLPLTTISAIVRVGDDATEVQLPSNPGGEQQSAHFAANVPFLRGAPIFSVQAKVRLNGHDITADFEPWVDPAEANHSQAAWICPMHPNIGSNSPGRCPIPGCGMALEPRLKRRPNGQLHDPDYTMTVSTTPSPAAQRPTRITLTLNHTGSGIVRNLETVHTKKLHLIVSSQDLSRFDHIHPDEQPDGSYSIDYTFPTGGDYNLFADLTPVGAPNQVFRLPIHVTGPQPARQALHESLAPSRLFGDYRISLATSPYPLQSNDESTLTFTLHQGGNPVSDLEPYLGAGGHCVILSEDSMDYLHSHPIETPAQPSTGPSVTFHTRFPRPGLYKIWGQFQHHGKVVVADFVLRVP